mmetsp:Transcript_64910/g.205060  ORF Transcript_64910/g.205060 Transcript_64910/m.205060 type:complete len:108 (+) Transcript_64910:57-380(+)
MAPKGKDVAKATKAAKAVKAGALKKGAMKRRTSVTFHRPKTLIRAREPAYPRQRCVTKAGPARCRGFPRGGARRAGVASPAGAYGVTPDVLHARCCRPARRRWAGEA